jgi:hypothetical protein
MLREFMGAAAAIVGSVAFTSVLAAGVGIDLRLEGGGKSTGVVAGNDVHLELWAQIHGSDTNPLNEGLSQLYTAIGSTVVNPGIGGSITGFTLQAAWANPIGAQQGAASDFNGDGIGDWGSNSSVTVDRLNYILAVADVAPGARFGDSQPPTTGAALVDGYEFLIGTGVFHVSAANGGELHLNAIIPTWTTINPRYAVYVQDGNLLTSNAFLNTPSLGTPVVLTSFPEPASSEVVGVILIGAGTCGRRFVQRKCAAARSDQTRGVI